MRITRFTQQTASQVVERLQNIATGYAAIYGYGIIKKDMITSTDAFDDLIYELGNITLDSYYFAIREMGVESGTRREVEERCKVLGTPVCIIKVEGAENRKFNVAIKVL